MTGYQQYLLSLGKQNARFYIDNFDLKAIIITGSLARGEADYNSDIDTIIYYNSMPDKVAVDELCQQAIESGGGIYSRSEDGFAYYKYIEGIKCDFGHGTSTGTEEIFNKVLSNEVDDLTFQLIVSGFLDSIPIYGESWVKEWKEKLAIYPDELIGKMVTKHLQFHSHWILEKMGADRNDHLFLADNFLKVMNNVLACLCGINKVYHPGKFKNVSSTVDKFHIFPPTLLYCVENIFSLPLSEGVNELTRLVKDTLSLIEQHCPEIDTKSAHSRLAVELRK